MLRPSPSPARPAGRVQRDGPGARGSRPPGGRRAKCRSPRPSAARCGCRRPARSPVAAPPPRPRNTLMPQRPDTTPRGAGPAGGLSATARGASGCDQSYGGYEAATTALSLAVVTVRGRWSWWRLGYRSGLVVDERLGREERRCRGIALGSQDVVPIGQRFEKRLSVLERSAVALRIGLGVLPAPGSAWGRRAQSQDRMRSSPHWRRTTSSTRPGTALGSAPSELPSR